MHLLASVFCLFGGAVHGIACQCLETSLSLVKWQWTMALVGTEHVKYTLPQNMRDICESVLCGQVRILECEQPETHLCSNDAV